ncbi:MAG: O-antigen ligase family protein [Sumerlaeia bacterium]
MDSSQPPYSKVSKEKTTRFTQARLSRTQQKRDKSSQDKARLRMFKRRKNWEQEQARLNFPVFLRKFCELLLISCLIGPVIAYNLQLGAVEGSAQFLRNFISTLEAWNGAAKIDVTSPLSIRFLHDLLYLFESNLPVLQLKTTVWLMFASLLVGFHLGSRIFERLVGRRVFADDLTQKSTGPDKRRLLVLCSIVAFLGWSLLSFSQFGWGPTIPALEPLLPEEFTTQSGGAFSAFVAWMQVLVALLFFISAEDLIRTRRLVYKLLGCIIGLAVVSAVIAFMLQARNTYFPFLNYFWINWGPNEVRNDLGSLIGHNTAISSYIMVPFLIIWSILMSHQGALRRRYVGLLIGVLGIFALILLMAQSRAAVPILLVMFTFLVVMLARQANLRPPMAYVVGLPLMLVLLVMTQLVQKEQNPFYRQSVTFEERISHLSFSHLQTETRLRILFATAPAVLQKPLLGWGFHAFPYAYPEIQGEYFDWVLQDSNSEDLFFFAPTPKKTERAHNEYLQTLFETGLVGFTLAMVALIAVLLAGLKVLQRSLRQRHVAIQLGILSSILALLLHGLADFPFRVAPIASMLLVLLAIWSAGERLWFIRVPSLEERPLNDSESELREKELIKREKNLAMPRKKLAVWGGLMCVIFVGLGVLHAFALQWFSAEVLNNSARQYATFYQMNRTTASEGQRLNVLNAALSRLERAHNLVPLNGESLFQKATLQYYVATELKQMLINAQRNSSEKEVAFYSKQMQNTLQQAADGLQRSLTEENYHGIYQLLGLIYFEKYQISNQDLGLLQQAMQNMKTSVHMNPGEANSILTLIQWYTRFQQNNTEELEGLINRLRVFYGGNDLTENTLFVDFIFEYILNIMEIGSFDTGYKRMKILQKVEPESPAFTLALANAALMTNQFDEALQLNRSVAIKDNPDARLFRGLVSLRQHRWEDAKLDLTRARANSINLSEQRIAKLQIIEPLLAAASQAPEESTAAWNNAVREIERDSNAREVLLESARSLFLDFNLPERSIQFFQRYIDTGGTLDHLDKALLAQVYRYKNEKALQFMKAQILEAQKSGTLPEQFPRFESIIIRADLQRANELDAEAIEGFRLYGDINQYILLELSSRIQETKFLLGEAIQ